MHPLITAFQQRIKNLRSSDTVLIVYDIDPDGLCSAVALAKLLEQTSAATILAEPTFDRSVLRVNIPTHVTHVMTVDLATEGMPQARTIHVPLTIIDHHPILDENTNALLIKPQLLYPDVYFPRYNTTLLINDLSQGIADLTRIEWILAAGCIADLAYLDHPHYIKDICARHGFPYNEDVWQTLPGRIAKLLRYALDADKDHARQLYPILLHAKNIQDVLDSTPLKVAADVETEMNRLTHDAHKNALRIPTGILYEVNSRYDLRSALCTALGLENEHRTIITYNKIDGIIRVSARRNDKQLPLDQILAEAVRGIDRSFSGGHPVACGAGIPVESFETFRTNLVAALTRYE